MAGFVSEERLAFGPWAALERMVARLVQHMGFRNVQIVGGSGDMGADVVGTCNSSSWVLQCKYRSSGAIDVAAAKEVVRSITSYQAIVAVAAANSYFNQETYEYQKKTKQNGIDLRLWTGTKMIEFYNALPSESKCRKNLRSYQLKAVESVEATRGLGAQTALVLMATGLGKSLVAYQLIANELDRNSDQEILVLAHTKGLVRQLEISSWTQLEKKHSTHLWTDGERPAYHGGVVFATWQSVAPALARGELEHGQFGMIVVDEAHHAPSHVYRDLLARLDPNFLVGLTATPWRGDEKRLESVFGDPVFSMDIVDGMQRGFLADVDYRMLTDGIDWEEVSRKTKQGLTVKDLNKLLMVPARDIAMVKLIAEKMRNLLNAKALAFCKSIEHANRLQPLFAAEGIRCAPLHSQLPREERFKNLSSFRAGRIDLLLSIEMLNEGIDVPDVNVVAFMRVTHSRRIFVQQLGRGLRLSPDKQTVLVMDFVADIRRIAAGININREARERGRNVEVIRFSDGRVVKFDNDSCAAFFDEYLADIADVESLDEGARLRFPDP